MKNLLEQTNKEHTAYDVFRELNFSNFVNIRKFYPSHPCSCCIQNKLDKIYLKTDTIRIFLCNYNFYLWNDLWLTKISYKIYEQWLNILQDFLHFDFYFLLFFHSLSVCVCVCNEIQLCLKSWTLLNNKKKKE